MRRKKFSQRECLKCDKLFLSEGPWHRVCHNCRMSNSNIVAVQEHSIYSYGTKRGRRGIVFSDEC